MTTGETEQMLNHLDRIASALEILAKTVYEVDGEKFILMRKG